MIIALDTETTSLDFFHGARPFIVTICETDKDPQIWEWTVDPLTRKPIVSGDDLYAIWSKIRSADEIILQNAKFDIQALTHLFKDDSTKIEVENSIFLETEHLDQPEGNALLRAYNQKQAPIEILADWLAEQGEEYWPDLLNQCKLGLRWDWSKLHDTLLAGHLLASNHPHNLTDMGIEYLNIDISRHEEACHEACEEARRYCRRHLPNWRIAKQGEPDLPSAKASCWKNDLWLPKRLAEQLPDEYPEDHPYRRLIAEYATADSFITVQLWKVFRQKLEQLDLWTMYDQVRRKLPRIQHIMETRGVTLSVQRLEEQVKKFTAGSKECEKICIDIAHTYNYPLELPKSGNNKSLKGFVFDVLSLTQRKWSERTGEPSMDKRILEQWELESSPEDPAHEFIKALMKKRRQDTAVSYLEGYTRFWLPQSDGYASSVYKILHPNTNPTGTDTLRWSFTNPNSANLSRQEGCNLREVFGPAEGREWYSMDAKNIELRIPAFEAPEPDLIYVFNHPDEPPYYGSYHLFVFDILHPEKFKKYGVRVKDDDVYGSTYYQWCKNGSFAIIYGCQEKKADATYHVPGAYQEIRHRFPNIAKLSDKMKAHADKYGYVETIPNKRLGCKRGYPLLCTRTEYGKVMPTIPLNYHVSGTAMDWMQNAMIKCQERLDEWNSKLSKPDYFMIMQVHDELVFDFPQRADPTKNPKHSNLWRIRELQKLMESCGSEDIGIPTPVGVEYHPETYARGIGI